VQTSRCGRSRKNSSLCSHMCLCGIVGRVCCLTTGLLPLELMCRAAALACTRSTRRSALAEKAPFIRVRVRVSTDPDTNSDALIHTRARLTALFLALPGWAGTRKIKPIWILLKQETVSGSGIRWAICESAPCSRQTTTSAPHHFVFLQSGCPSCRPTNSVKALKALINLMH